MDRGAVNASGRYYDPNPRVNVVRVLGGYAGQIYVGDQIVWETRLHDDGQDAETEAQERIVSKLKELFQ